MLEFIVIASVVLGIVLLALFGGLFFIFGNAIPSMIAALVGFARDKEDLVDPDAEIMPVQERHSSEVLKDKAAAVKAFEPLPIAGATPPAPMPVQQTNGGVTVMPVQPQAAAPVIYPEQPVYVPPPAPVAPVINPQESVYVPPPVQASEAPVYAPPPVNPEQAIYAPPAMQEPPPVAQPPQPLVERAPILDIPNPIVQAPAAPLDGSIPDDVAHVPVTSDKSIGSVRHSSLPANRMVRDKRRSRNSAD